MSLCPVFQEMHVSGNEADNSLSQLTPSVCSQLAEHWSKHSRGALKGDALDTLATSLIC